MWSETDKRYDATQRIVRGSQAFKDRFGILPKVCIVSAADASVAGQDINGVMVVQCDGSGGMVVQPNVYYLGMGE